MQIDDQVNEQNLSEQQQFQEEQKNQTDQQTVRQLSDFEQQLLRFQPEFIRRDYEQNNVVLINGINYEKLSKTEIAYFLSKKPTLQQKKKQIQDENLKPKYPTNKKAVENLSTINGKQNRYQEKKEFRQDKDDLKKEFCICRQAGEKEGEMVSCDNCKEWFHPFCLKISKITLNNIITLDNSKWYCNKCISIVEEAIENSKQFNKKITQNKIYKIMFYMEKRDLQSQKILKDNSINLFDISFILQQKNKQSQDSLQIKYQKHPKQIVCDKLDKENNCENFKNVYKKIAQIQNLINKQNIMLLQKQQLTKTESHLTLQQSNSEEDDQEQDIERQSKIFNKVTFSFEINHVVPKLSFTLGQFPDEIDPINFFAQKLTFFQEFIDYLTQNYQHSEVLQIYFWNYKHQQFFQPLKILLKSKIKTQVYYMTMSVSYFLVNCSELIQLCFVNKLMFYLLQNNIKKQFITNEIFLKVLNKIINPYRSSLHQKIRKQTRKSIFHNNKNNFLVQHNKPELNKKKSNSQENVKSRHRTSIMKKPFFSRQTSKSTCNFEQLKSDIISEVSEESKSESSNSEQSDSDDNSDSSFEEEEYESNNPYQILYKKLQHRSIEYQIHIEQPKMIFANGDERFCTSEEIHCYLSTSKQQMLNEFFKIKFFQTKLKSK